MKIHLLILSVCIFLNLAQWQKVEIDPSLDRLQVDSTDWSYPWYMVRHSGGWENTMGEPISKKDTAHLIRNSWCLISDTWGNDTTSQTHRLPFAVHTWKDDTLKLSIYDYSASNGEELSLIIVAGQFIPQYWQEYFIPNKYQEVTFLQYSLALDNLPRPNVPIKGRLKINLVEEILSFESEENDTISIYKTIEGEFVIP